MGTDVGLEAARVFIYANESITLKPGSKIKSLIQNDCSESLDEDAPRLYQCINLKYNEDEPLGYESMIKYYNEQFDLFGTNKEARSSRTLDSMIFDKWRIYLLSLGTIDMQESVIQGPRVGLCSNELYLSDSRIDANGRGCPPDTGIGSTKRVAQCGGAGGAHGGRGGYGASESSDESVIEQCKATFPKPYYFGKEANLEGSGGTSGDKEKSTGGYGGGIVWLTTPRTTTLENTTVASDGGWGRSDVPDQFGAGGGAGGSV